MTSSDITAAKECIFPISLMRLLTREKLKLNKNVRKRGKLMNKKKMGLLEYVVLISMST